MLLGFSVFLDKVSDGRKKQTIRKMRKKRRFRQGDSLQFYTGLRTKKCRKLREDSVASEVIDISIQYCPKFLGGEDAWRVDQFLKNSCVVQMTAHEIEDLAVRDGFDSAKDMMEWFGKTHSEELKHSSGTEPDFQVIRWTD